MGVPVGCSSPDEGQMWLLALSSPLGNKGREDGAEKGKIGRWETKAGGASDNQASATRRTRALGRKGRAARPVGVGGDELSIEY
jgi:hypothetical protein